MSELKELQMQLRKIASKDNFKPIFFKMGVGQYAEHDQFIGVSMPALKKLAKQAEDLSLTDVSAILQSPINEERQLALLILSKRYQGSENKDAIFKFLLEHITYVNNWNLVDHAAPAIIGAHLFKQDKSLLVDFAKSKVLWERRIAIVATYYFIRQGSLEWTLKIAEMLLKDSHDLIHKAVGWMLRELGKRDEALLQNFLDQHGNEMPRTMLRYAIEKFPKELRLSYLRK